MSFRQGLLARAAKLGGRVVLPEGGDERIHAAAERLRQGKIAEPIVLSEALIKAHPLLKNIQAHLAARDLARGKPSSELQTLNPLEFGAAMVALGEAEACVAGAAHTT
ncbi:MAG TPA: phosphate acyltransferase, partial [Gemmatimonadales bacterium]